MSEKEERKEGELSDSIAIKGYVTIWQGEGKEKKIICERKENHWVDQGIRGLISALIGELLESGTDADGDIWSWMKEGKIYLGSDTGAATTHAMTELTSPIGAVPGTAPDTVTGADLTNPTSGTFKASIIAQWLAGAVSGTVGELALYLGLWTSLTPNWEKKLGIAETPFIYPSLMASRLSDADGDFSSFVIDPTKSLTVQWDLEVSFA